MESISTMHTKCYESEFCSTNLAIRPWQVKTLCYDFCFRSTASRKKTLCKILAAEGLGVV